MKWNRIWGIGSSEMRKQKRIFKQRGSTAKEHSKTRLSENINSARGQKLCLPSRTVSRYRKHGSFGFWGPGDTAAFGLLSGCQLLPCASLQAGHHHRVVLWDQDAAGATHLASASWGETKGTERWWEMRGGSTPAHACFCEQPMKKKWN